jgi:acetyl esterase/lipase
MKKLVKMNRGLNLFMIVWVLLLICPPEVAGQFNEVTYGRKDGMALTMVVQPPSGTPNGKGIIWVVSAGWTSAYNWVTMFKGLAKPIADRGYTVFYVMHGSQPKYTVPEAVSDLKRAIRFIRYHAADYNIDPEHIGITGASAGGHLSLMMGTTGDDGNNKARDPVDRVSSRIQAVACFFPPTDFLNYKTEGDNAVVHSDMKEFQAPLDFTEWNEQTFHFIPVTDPEKRTEIGRQISPLYFVSVDDAPTLIAHGDADKIVPLSQSQRIVEKLKEAGVPCELKIKPGAEHGFWNDMMSYTGQFADWFDRFLIKNTE